MGIQGLQSYVTKRLGLRHVPHEPLNLASAASSEGGWDPSPSPRGVVFDGESLCYWVTENPWTVGNRVDSVHGGESLHMYATYLKFFQRFMEEQIPICVVFDGIKLASKKATLIGRHKQANSQASAELCSENYGRSLFARRIMLEVLQALSTTHPGWVIVRNAVAEADGDCVKLARDLGAFGVIGNDSDYFALLAHAPAVKYISILSLAFTGTMHRYYPGWEFEDKHGCKEFELVDCNALHEHFRAWRQTGAVGRTTLHLAGGKNRSVAFCRSDDNPRDFTMLYQSGLEVIDVRRVKRPVISCRYFDSSMFAAALGIDVESMPVLAAFIGTDFLPQSDLRKFHEEIGVLVQASGWLDWADIPRSAAAMVRESIGGRTADEMRDTAVRLLSSPRFGIDPVKITSAFDFLMLRPTPEESLLHVYLRLLRLWGSFSECRVEPNVLKILGSSKHLRCPPTMEADSGGNPFHSRMNDHMRPLMLLFEPIFDLCLIAFRSYFLTCAPLSLECKIFLAAHPEGIQNFAAVIQNPETYAATVRDINMRIAEHEGSWIPQDEALFIPRDFIIDIAATQDSLNYMDLPTVVTMRQFVIRSFRLLAGVDTDRPVSIVLHPRVVDILLDVSINDSEFLDLCSFFCLVDMGYPNVYADESCPFDLMVQAYFLSILFRKNRLDADLATLRQGCLSLQPFSAIPLIRRNCALSFLSALSYGHILIDQAAVILNNTFGSILPADVTWSPSFKDLIDGRLFHFILDLEIRNGVADATMQGLKNQPMYMRLMEGTHHSALMLLMCVIRYCTLYIIYTFIHYI
jgi:hypothetical protein